MAKNFIFILTEGDHDSAFIYRILKANGISTHHVLIKDYPYPLNELFKSGISSVSIENLNIDSAHSRFLPSRVMQKGDNILSIYKMGGDSQEQKRVDFIKSIYSFKLSDPNALQVMADDISILFFFDADDKGVESRIEQVKDELSFLEEVKNISNKNCCLVGNINIGVFIFTEQNKNIGLLEDILLPLMRKENDNIFSKAEAFLDIHESTTLFKGKVKYDKGDKKIKKEVNGEKYSHKKSLIGTVGQLQVSGASNTVCISKADYLTDGKIKENTTCNEIYDFIQKALN